MDEIIELRTNEDWKRAHKVMRELREKLSEEDFLKRRTWLQCAGYRFFGLEVNGGIVSVVGFRLYPHVANGVDCWVDDLVTLSAYRSKGYGKRLMEFVEAIAKETGCVRICVHTRKFKEEARKFYGKHLGYDEYAVVFQKFF